ncbi:MAG TPA: UDP-glucose 6-dehydrogenase, partial [Acidobacteria bacterium]|nr:UDP-glucose 6-dehydrogenase [Acidobacteriota bacterium]
AKDSRYRFRILEAVETVNATQKRRLFDKMRRGLGPLRGERIGLWG